MKKIIEKIKKMNSQRIRHITLRVVIGVFALLVVYRFVMFGMEQHAHVFNLTRDAINNGTPVSVIEMKKTNGVIYEPLFINNNRGYVSGMRVPRFSVGQKIVGGGEVVSVSKNIDIDTGMYVVRTRGASDGARMVEIKGNGFFVPTYAVQNGMVYVVRDGVARALSVNIVRGDSNNTMITGVSDNDIVITSRVTEGSLVKIIK